MSLECQRLVYDKNTVKQLFRNQHRSLKTEAIYSYALKKASQYQRNIQPTIKALQLSVGCMLYISCTSYILHIIYSVI